MFSAPPSEGSAPRHGAAASGAVLASIALILVVCLVPTGREVAPIVRLCIVCGSSGLASFFLNIVLYLPLGMALRVRFGSIGIALIGGFLLSLFVEITQLAIPGRFTTLGDLVANTTGAGVGALLTIRTGTWLLPGFRSGNVLTFAWALAASLGIGATGALLSPSVPSGDLYAQWTPRLQNLESYQGRVVAAHLEDLPLSLGLLEDQEAVRNLLREGAPVTLRFEAATSAPGLAPVLRLVAGPFGRGVEALQVGVDREDLVIRPRYRADDVLLSRPHLRLTGVMRAFAPGDTVELVLREEAGRGHRVTLGGGTPVSLGLTAGRGWSLLRYTGRLSDRVLQGLDLLWITALLLPLGWWSPSRTRLLLAASLPLATLAIVPLWAFLLPTPISLFLAGVVGIVSGSGLRMGVERWRSRSVR